MEHRSYITEIRAENGENGKFIDGYFATFTGVYTMWDGATESIAPHAFDGQLDDDIRALINHDTTLVLGRTKAKTLELRIDDCGLWGRIHINPDDTDALNLWQRVQRGDVDQCSFGFDIIDEKTELRADGSVHWTLQKVKLYEVSPCTFPAYEDTSITARHSDYENIKKRSFDAWESKQKGRIEKWHLNS